MCDPFDKATAATLEGVPSVGTLIEVEWTSPLRWEPGRITEHVIELDRDRPVVHCRVAYEDGTTFLENFSEVDARPLASGATVSDATPPFARIQRIP